MITLCINCLSEESHQCLFGEAIISQCELCFTKDTTCVEISPDDALTRYANCLIKFNYDDSAYCGKDWPEKIQRMFRSEQWVFNFTRNFSSDDLRSIISRLLKHDGCGKDNLFELSTCFDAWKSDSQGFLIRRLQDAFFGYSQLQMDISVIYEQIHDCLEEFIPQESVYRARLGYNTRNESGTNLADIKPFSAFEGDDLSAPPNALAKNGRINRAGFSILYLAEDEYTAIQEIRPNPGDFVSVGKFSLMPTLRIANFYDVNIIDFVRTKGRVESLQLIANLNSLFSLPIGSFNHHHYLSTQMLAEKLIEESYDGICYKSSFTGARNIAIFDKEKSKYVRGSSKLIKIDNVTVVYHDSKYSV